MRDKPAYIPGPPADATVTNVKQCDYCGGPIDRFGGKPEIDGNDPASFGTRLECRCCGSVGDCHVGIMQPPDHDLPEVIVDNTAKGDKP